jgi:hypothetical protein
LNTPLANAVVGIESIRASERWPKSINDTLGKGMVLIFTEN